MKLKELSELLSASFGAKQDVFLKGVFLPSFDELILLSEGIKTLVLLPSPLYSSVKNTTAVISGEVLPDIIPQLCLADIHLMNEQFFRDYVENCRFERIIIPFAELADENEYGYCRGYRWVGEMRAESTHYSQLVCLFSHSVQPSRFAYAYSSVGTVLTDISEKKDYRVIECPDEKKKYETLLHEARKQTGTTALVFFPTRTQATDFSFFCASKGVTVPVITGACTQSEIKKALSDFISGRVQIIAGTKSMLSVFSVIHCDKAFIGGVPFSQSFLERCLALADKGTVVFCREDYEKEQKLTDEFVDCYTQGAGECIRKKRHEMLSLAMQDLYS